jgi:integrase
MAKVGYRIKSDKQQAVSIYANFRSPGSKMLETRTGLSVHPKDWTSSKQRTRGKDPHLQQLNYDLSDLSNYLSKSINEVSVKGEAVNLKWFKQAVSSFFNRIEEKDLMLVGNFMDEFLNRIEKGEIAYKPNTIKSHKQFKNMLEEYEVDVEYSLRFDLLDRSQWDDFYSWLLNEKKFKPTYIPRILSRLKFLCNEAASYGIKVDPSYLAYKGRTSSSGDYINVLTEEELELIKRYEPKNNHLANTKKWIVMGFYMGQRASDLLKITSKDIRKSKEGDLLINIKQVKTGKSITIGVKDPYVKQIVDSEFPHPISLQNLNQYFKKLSELAGINSPSQGYLKNSSNRLELVTGPKYLFLSSHDLRRSFATHYFNKGIQTSILMNITGHSRESDFFKYMYNVSIK